MRTSPFQDVWQFLIGATPDHEALGWGRYLMVVLLFALLLGSALIAVANWRRNPEQRSLRHIAIALTRVLIGTMWFQGSLWKLPLPEAPGLRYWTEQMTHNAAFAFVSEQVENLVLPNMKVLDPLVFLLELGLAVSFILGAAVRPAASVGALYALGLWIGLYRHPDEWPWEYIFLSAAQLLLAIQSAGRSLGVDALLATRFRRTALAGI